MVTEKEREALALAVRAAAEKVKARAVMRYGRGYKAMVRTSADADAYRVALDAHATALEVYKSATGRDYWTDRCHQPPKPDVKPVRKKPMVEVRPGISVPAGQMEEPAGNRSCTFGHVTPWMWR